MNVDLGRALEHEVLEIRFDGKVVARRKDVSWQPTEALLVSHCAARREEDSVRIQQFLSKELPFTTLTPPTKVGRCQAINHYHDVSYV